MKIIITPQKGYKKMYAYISLNVYDNKGFRIYHELLI